MVFRLPSQDPAGVDVGGTMGGLFGNLSASLLSRSSSDEFRRQNVAQDGHCMLQRHPGFHVFEVETPD